MIKVMIADDQELIRQSLQIVLSTHEDLKVVDAVENGFAVLESIKKERPDVILMDIRMPVSTGIEGTKLIKEAYPEVFIVRRQLKKNIQILKSLSLPLLMMMNLSLAL